MDVLLFGSLLFLMICSAALAIEWWQRPADARLSLSQDVEDACSSSGWFREGPAFDPHAQPGRA